MDEEKDPEEKDDKEDEEDEDVAGLQDGDEDEDMGEQRLGDRLWDAVHDFSDADEEVVSIQDKSLRALSESKSQLVLQFIA